MRLAALDLEAIYKAATSLPKVVKQAESITGAAQAIQSPQFQQQVREIRRDVETYAKVQLALQVLSTLAIVGLFAIQLAERRRS